MEFLQDANIVYLLLMAGLWVSATSAYIPGTGVAEAAGAALILGAVALFATLATNWIAVIALVIGAAIFLLLPLLKPDWATYAIGGLLVQVAASFFLFSATAVSPLFIGLGAGLAWLYHRTVLRAIQRQNRELSSTQKDAFLVGARGRVVGEVEDRLTVQVNGELWTARSRSRLEGGAEIVVTEQDGLELRVDKAKRESAD